MEKEQTPKYSWSRANELQQKTKLNYRFIDPIKFGEQHPNFKDLPTEHFDKFHMKFKVSSTPLPSKVDLSHLVKEVYDQGNVGSCVANSIAMAYRMTIQVYNSKSLFHTYAWNYKDIKPARLFMYFYNRLLEGTPPKEDSGSTVLSGFRSVVEHGVVDELYWPYNEEDFSKIPTPSVNAKAMESNTPGYHKVKNNLVDLKHALANKQPIAFGAVLFKSFFAKEVANTGVVPVPKKVEKDVCGGHCLLIVGYNDDEEVFLVKNSWSEDWGMNGVCKIPYAYITDTDLCADFWCFSRI